MPESSPNPTATVFQQIPIDQIRPSSYQLRKDFDVESIQSLAESIDKEGLIQPITIRRMGDAYELIAGERRLRAIKKLGWATIEARVIEVVSEAAASAKGLVENLQRKDLNPIEEAEGFASLNQMDPKYWTQEQIGQVAGRDKGYISRSISLLGLPETIKDELRARNFSRSHAVEFLRLPSQEKRLEAMKIVQNGKLSWEKTRTLIEGMLGDETLKPAGNPATTEPSEKDPMASIWSQVLANRSIEAMGGWTVTYRKEHWNFSLSSTAVPNKEALVTWLVQLANALTMASETSDHKRLP